LFGKLFDSLLKDERMIWYINEYISKRD
jgi:hypothetical protein